MSCVFGLKGRFRQPRPKAWAGGQEWECDPERVVPILPLRARTALSGPMPRLPPFPGLRPGLTEPAFQAENTGQNPSRRCPLGLITAVCPPTPATLTRQFNLGGELELLLPSLTQRGRLWQTTESHLISSHAHRGFPRGFTSPAPRTLPGQRNTHGLPPRLPKNFTPSLSSSANRPSGSKKTSPPSASVCAA